MNNNYINIPPNFLSCKEMDSLVFLLMVLCYEFAHNAAERYKLRKHKYPYQ